jgi:hypothetical protein
MGFMDLLKKGASAAHGTLLDMQETKEKYFERIGKFSLVCFRY